MSILTTAVLVGLLYSLVTVGLCLAFRVLDYPDLTLEGGMVFGATASLLTLQATGNVILSLLAGLAAGAAAGAMTASLHLFLGVSRLLSGIVTAAFLYSVDIRLLGKVSVVRYSSGPTLFTPDPYIAQPQLKCILLLLAIVGSVVILLSLFFRTRAGLLLRGLGEDERFVTVQGANPKIYLVGGLAAANALIGLCGALVFHFHRVVDVNLTAGMLIAALAALVLGETLIPSRYVWQYLCACIVGTLVYQAFVTFVLFGMGRAMSDVIIASDVRLLTGLCFVVPCVLLRYRRYRLFYSRW